MSSYPFMPLSFKKICAAGTWVLLGWVFFVACRAQGSAVPTPMPLANLPVVPTHTPEAVSVVVQPIETGVVGEETAVPTPLLLLTPAGIGISPNQAKQFYVPDAGPAEQTGWQLPTYPVPLAIHPDDHYWLIRPLASNVRNYSLEWYPFGNDVLATDLAPYRVHHGLDFPNPVGTPVLAAGSGRVIYAGPLPSPRDGINYYGNTVIIEHNWQWLGKPVYTLYAHTLELFVAAGDDVQQGQLIAGVGSSGEVTGSHLHFEVRVGENHYNEVRNPALWLSPYEGYGTLAGQFADRFGRLIPGALVTVEQDEEVLRTHQTYLPPVKSDEVWQENFVIGDLPAGVYTLKVVINGILYRREVTVLPGQTNFVQITTEFEFIPTPTAEATATPGSETPTPQP